MMLLETVETPDTYEAAWLLMNGAVIKDVVFEMDQVKNDGNVRYKIILGNVNNRSRYYWQQFRAIANVNSFSSVRIKLKKQINEFKKQKLEGQMPA